MPLVINTNLSSINSQRHLALNTAKLSGSFEKLSSGFRINRAGDDAAGLQLSENLRTQIRGSEAALSNVQDGMNVLNIADGAMGVITKNLQRMRELAVQAANDTYDASQRTAIQQEITARANDVTRISNATEFNGRFLLDGTTNGAGNFVLQVGPNNVAANDTIDVGATGAFADIDATQLGVNALAVDTNANANIAIGSLDTAITSVNAQRASLGSIVNQLESASENLMLNIENTSSSESRIRNVDVAAESAELVKNQILQQASSTMLAQANQSPSLALQLLQG